MKKSVMRMCLAAMLAGLAGAKAEPGQAGSVPESGLSLDLVVEQVLAGHPGLAGLRLQAAAIAEAEEQATTLPEPMLSLGVMERTSTGSNWGDAGEKRLVVEQALPWFGKRALSREIAGQDSAEAGLAVAALALRLQRQAKEAFHELYATRRILDVVREDQQILQRLGDLAGAQYATGKLSQTDLLRAETEKKVQRQKVIELEAQAAVLASGLNQLLNRSADQPVGDLLAPPEFAAAAIPPADLSEAAAGRPNVLAALARAERYGLQAELKGREVWPDPVLSVEYRGYKSGGDMLMLMVGFSLPIWSSSRQAGVRQAELMRQANLAEARAAALENGQQIHAGRVALEAARQVLALYRQELMPQAEAGFQANEAGYRNGKVSFADLLESRRLLLDTRIRAIGAAAEVGRQAARLEEVSDRVPGRDEAKEQP